MSDGEFNFQITLDHWGNCRFKFKIRIGMHINDRPPLGLVYIRNMLGLGKLYKISTESICSKKINWHKYGYVLFLYNVLKLINIFTSIPP